MGAETSKGRNEPHGNNEDSTSATQFATVLAVLGHEEYHKILGIHTYLRLALVCRQAFEAVKTVINQNGIFVGRGDFTGDYSFRPKKIEKYQPVQLGVYNIMKSGDYDTIHRFKVTHFYFSAWFGKLDWKYLPASITHLKVQKCKYKIGQLPPNLTHFDIYYTCATKIAKFPESITHLRFRWKDQHNPIEEFPPKLTYLALECTKLVTQDLHNLPTSLTHLIISDLLLFNNTSSKSRSRSNSNSSNSSTSSNNSNNSSNNSNNCSNDSNNSSTNDDNNYENKELIFPDSITSLEITPNWKHTYRPALHSVKLPSKITELSLSFEFSSMLYSLPSTLTNLSFDAYLDVCPRLQPTLTHITFGPNFNGNIDNIANTITHITTSKSFNQLVNKLPSALTHLKFGNQFNQPISSSIFPSKLTHLSFGYEFQQNVNPLPDSITHLAFGIKFRHDISPIPSNIAYLRMLYHNEMSLALCGALTHAVYVNMISNAKELPVHLRGSLDILHERVGENEHIFSVFDYALIKQQIVDFAPTNGIFYRLSRNHDGTYRRHMCHFGRSFYHMCEQYG